MTPIYYKNAAGKVAVSLDDGAHVVLPTGRTVELFEAWSECEDDLHDELTPEQRERVNRVAAANQAREDTRVAAEDLVDEFNRNRDSRRNHLDVETE